MTIRLLQCIYSCLNSIEMLGGRVVFLLALSLSDCVDRWTLRPRWWLNGSGQDVQPSQWELRERFLLDLMLQVHKPLLQQELIQMGRHLNENPDDYQPGTWPLLLEFMDAVHQGRILRPFSIYSQLHEQLPQQLLGVYRFLVLAKDWKTFQRNACYARSHFNPVLFVNALQLAMVERVDTQGLTLPAMHEVLPQLYFNREVIIAAQLVNWHQLAPVPTISYKRSWREILGNFVYPKIFRPQSSEVELMPADPMVIEVTPLETQLSLDVELNGYWSRFISRLILADLGSAIIDGDRLMAFHNEHDEFIFRGNPAKPEDYLLLMHNIRQFVALLQLEELATGKRSLQLIEPTLLTTGGVPYRATGLTAEAVQQLIRDSIEELRNHIDNELTKTFKLQPMCTVGRVIAARYWKICRHLSHAVNENRVEPNLLGMSTSNLRDPIYRLLLIKMAQLICQYELRFATKSHYRQQLQLREIRVGQLKTYDEFMDTDLINLMDTQLLQTQRNNLQLLRRRLVARQLRLNHKPFNMTFQLFTQTPMQVLFRSYLIPPGHKQPQLLLDSFVSKLSVGENQLERHFPSAFKGLTLSDLYEAKQPIKDISEYQFPQHLLLPRGTAEGLELQLLVEILPWHTTEWGPECGWIAGMEDWTTHVLVSNILDVTVQHQHFNVH